MNFRHLQYFVAVAEELHFGRAAARLHIAQPPLSQMIRRLEAELHVRLFDRNRRTAELTAAGRAFLHHARVALAEVERGREAAARASRGEIGQLVLGMLPSGDTKLFTKVLRRFGRRFPSVQLVLQSLSTAAQIDAILDGRLDAGFLRMPVHAPRLEVRVISRETLVLALPADHPKAGKAALTLEMLAEETHIMFPRRLAPDYYDTIVGLFRQAGLRLRIAQEAEHVQTHLGLIAAGFGFSLLPASMQDFQLPGVAFRPITDPVPEVETAIAYRRDDCSEALQALLAVVDESLPRLMSRNRPAADRAGDRRRTVALAENGGGPLGDQPPRTRPSASSLDRVASRPAGRRRRAP